MIGRLRSRRTSALTTLAAAIMASLVGCTPGDATAGSPGPATVAPPGVTATPTVAAIPTGRSTQTIDVSGESRMVHLYRPTGLTGSAPLVVMLHGGYGDGTQAENAYHWDAAADRGDFIVAFPDGTDRSWNAGGGCCGPASRTGVDDVAFLTEMVTTLGRETTLDPDRIFISGVSNGGAMAYRMACETDLFAAVGVDSTTMLVECSGAAPASVLHIHGSADPIIRYDGAPGRSYSPGSAPIDGPPVPDVAAAWRTTDDCPAPQTSSTGDVTTSTAQCPAGRAVELITIAGAGHQWPGGQPNPRAEVLGAGTPSTALDATRTISEFFASHPRSPAGTPGG
ncbi:plasmid partitioning protein [Pseudofrankia asymbiotica]|uniref:Plasmid partitioning protein n=2 Tax=Pseudofrankia asymbiotica TaxID=1834516 RepID=A0A1V2IC36_9ACTN|nr:plasmid partitioning protein [Pseudofrankia asymbiotica]